MMGAAVVPLAYMSVWLLTKSLMSSLFAALLILLGIGLYSTWQSFELYNWSVIKPYCLNSNFWILLFSDVGTLTLSRHILLDPIMMFFIMMSTYSQLKFLSYRDRSALSYHFCQSCIQYRYSIIAHIIYMYV